MHYLFIIFFIISSSVYSQSTEDVFFTRSGKISFKSDAPLELITASSSEVRGVIDIKKNNFAFSVPVKSFQGFNSPLQKEHFNENYMESDKFPTATFSGKIIEDIDFTTEGNYTIRAKGILTVHGVEQERIIKSDININNGIIQIQSKFIVLLEEHNIKIPKIVFQKIAPEIQVEINAQLAKK
jgi:hypothetical protein